MPAVPNSPVVAVALAAAVTWHYLNPGMPARHPGFVDQHVHVLLRSCSDNHRPSLWQQYWRNLVLPACIQAPLINIYHTMLKDRLCQFCDLSQYLSSQQKMMDKRPLIVTDQYTGQHQDITTC